MNSTHKYEQLIEIFDGCFADDFNTRLIKGDDEPIYLPADDEVPYNRIVFAHGFYASGCTRFRTGALPGKRVASWWTSVTGTARTDATPRPRASLKMWK
jgi:elongation factor P hydroxylase